MSLLTSPKLLCQQYQIKPLRRRGQNFLINDFVIKKILKAADLKKKDNVLEIGPGLGILTKEISKKVKKVIAIEIDKKLIEVLKQELKGCKNIEIIQGSILDFKCSNVPMLQCSNGFKLVASLPFNITGLVFKQFLAGSIKPEIIVVILQKEVGERIIARSPRMSKLSVMVQFYGQPKIISNIKKDNFWPKPKVDSVILKIKPFISSRFQDENLFFQIVRAGFSSPRKYLLNNLVKSAMIENIGTLEKKNEIAKTFRQAGLNPKVRAQELSVEDWIKLVKILEYENKK